MVSQVTNMRITRMMRMVKSMKRKRKIQKQLRKKKSGSSLAVKFTQNGILVRSQSCRAYRGCQRPLEMDELDRGIGEIRVYSLN
ncbi:hypothetical protein D8674_013484 [Pyrus ussuriensis x Pyrus communis]|uniref:Uncharacterized protein n=1 Tax=Pyrus ussuriensis x Pyrus communis TaxID=2448454 RepID=A0A5N5GPW6_9ROSA|nr:hypothetical protein D8674_013484 [Pyrus ussuriensis x Pyrus communis]